MTDRIELTGIEVQARHGVTEAERATSQRFLVDVTLWVDARPAGSSDDIIDTVDYGRVAVLAHNVVQGESHRLIERVAERVAEVLLEETAVQRVSVTVHKPDAPIPLEFADVSVTVDRVK